MRSGSGSRRAGKRGDGSRSLSGGIGQGKSCEEEGERTLVDNLLQLLVLQKRKEGFFSHRFLPPERCGRTLRLLPTIILRTRYSSPFEM